MRILCHKILLWRSDSCCMLDQMMNSSFCWLLRFNLLVDDSQPMWRSLCEHLPNLIKMFARFQPPDNDSQISIQIEKLPAAHRSQIETSLSTWRYNFIYQLFNHCVLCIKFKLKSSDNLKKKYSCHFIFSELLIKSEELSGGAVLVSCSGLSYSVARLAAVSWSLLQCDTSIMLPLPLTTLLFLPLLHITSI